MTFKQYLFCPYAPPSLSTPHPPQYNIHQMISYSFGRAHTPRLWNMSWMAIWSICFMNIFSKSSKFCRCKLLPTILWPQLSGLRRSGTQVKPYIPKDYTTSATYLIFTRVLSFANVCKKVLVWLTLKYQIRGFSYID